MSIPAPVPGICFDGVIKSVHDGDTLTFVVATEYQVRLEDCWAAELKDLDGPAMAQILREMAAGKRGRLFIPFRHTGKFGDEMSFNRVVGRVWLDGDESDLSERMVKAAAATAKRPRKEKK